MIPRAPNSAWNLLLSCLLVAGCGGDGARDGDGDGGYARHVAELTALLPADARGVLAVDVAGLLVGSSAAQATALLGGTGGDPALAAPLGAVGALAAGVDVPGALSTALLVQTTDAADGLLLLAKVRGETLAAVATAPLPTPAGTYGAAGHALSLDAAGHHLALLPGGVLIAGRLAAVQSVLDVADGAAPAGASALAALLGALDPGAPFAFVYGLPALLDDAVAPDGTLRGAAVVSGALAFDGDELTGHVAFHAADAAGIVATYNALNRAAVEGDAPLEPALALRDPVAAGLAQAVVTVPPTPIAPTRETLLASRSTAKKLLAGLEAHAYAEGVADPGNAALVDLLVKSEADGDTPPSPGSVFIRWEFLDEAAVAAFEANELPAGFRLAPCRFLETDAPDGELFLALNLYNAGGGSIVSGARAEWDVFVEPPAGADPGAGTRPRFMVVDALAEAVSADPVNLMTPAEPLSHALVEGRVVTTVGRLEDGEPVPVFSSSFPRPDPAVAPVARFTREMAIGNDYIYWGHGVHDRALYNATTFNHDAYHVDPGQVTVADASRWAQHLKPDVKDVVYYVNTLEYVASPMANLRSPHLDITPEWLAELLAFKTNGHQRAIMRTAVEQLFRGTGDALVPFRVPNETPSTCYAFEVTDPGAMAEALDLPPGHALASLRILEGGPEASWLTLCVYAVEGALEGLRAEWSVPVDDGSGRPRTWVAELMTEDVAADPARLLSLPGEVRHTRADGRITTRLSSPAIAFEASFATAGATAETLALDWIEAGDNVCRPPGVCDSRFYDAGTLDAPAYRPAAVTVDALATPWAALVAPTPAVVFYRDTPQDFAVKRWQNVKVPVPELPFAGLDGATHALGGTGALVGRTASVVDSTYTYAGDALIDGGRLVFALDQQIDNLLGTAHIYTTGGFDLATGLGTQTVTDCAGPALMCSGVVDGSTAYYTAQALDASDPDAITWEVNVVVDLGGTFGLADSASTLTATRAE